MERRAKGVRLRRLRRRRARRARDRLRNRAPPQAARRAHRPGSGRPRSHRRRRLETPAAVHGRMQLRHALALGLIHGPTELLQVSSTAHTSLIPLLARWSYSELDPHVRKTFEVALHAGAGAALALDMHEELLDVARRASPADALLIAASLAPPALAGLLFGGFIARRLSRPRTIAA